jgi:acetolactate synthase-1/2/3 large subunit
MHGGDRIAEVLERHGTRFLFTLCGGHISPILVGAKGRGIRVVDTRHEATAVFAADAVSRMTGTVGVAAVTAGPGVANSLTAIVNARLAQSPLLLFGGATATVLEGRGALQDIDQRALVASEVKWYRAVRRVRDLAPAVEEGLHRAREGVPGPVFVEVPVDLLYPEATVRKWYGLGASGGGLAGRLERAYLGHHLSRLFASGSPAAPAAAPSVREPSAAESATAAGWLRRAERPVLVVGSQAVPTPPDAEGVAGALRELGMPVFLSGMARGLLGAGSPALCRHRRREALREADLVILAGVPLDFRLDYGRQIARRARIVSVNLTPGTLRRNRRPALAVEAAPGRFLVALAAELGAAGGGSGWGEWRERLAARDAEREREIDADAAVDSSAGVNPVRLFRELDRILDEGSVMVADGGDFVATASYVTRPRSPLCWLDPGPFGTLGVGAGFALAAKLLRPEADVWLLWGDGSCGYGLAEIDTFARHRLPVIALVGNDASWAQIAREQVPLLGDAVGTELARTAYERAAEGLGARGLRLDKSVGIAGTLSAAKALARQGQPVLVNAHLAPSEFRKGSISI